MQSAGLDTILDFKPTLMTDGEKLTKWQKEVLKFAPEMTVQILHKSAAEGEPLAVDESRFSVLPPTAWLRGWRSCPKECPGPGKRKHVAAVLYGLDCDPLLFFTLRSIDCQELIKRSVESKLERMLENAGKKSERAIGEDGGYDLFGI